MQKKILQFSDLHIDCNHEQNLDVLKQILDKLIDEAQGYDFALVTGDVVNDGTAKCYHLVKEQFLRLKLPVYFLPGNEDDLVLMKEILNTKNLYCVIGYIKSKSYDLFTLDTTMPNSCSGYLGEASLKALEKHLIFKYKAGEEALVAMHHPPFLTGTKWLDQIKLENMQEVMSLFDKYKSKVDILVLTGHIHQDIYKIDEKLKLLSCPAVSKQFTKNETGVLRFDDSRHCYREIIINNSLNDITTQVITLEL